MFNRCGPSKKLKVIVYTGDHSKARGSINIKLFDQHGGETSEIKLTTGFSGTTKKFSISKSDYGTMKVSNTTTITSIQLSTDDSDAHWFINKIIVKSAVFNADVEDFVFPIFKKIQPGVKQTVVHLDTSLPQKDKYPAQRKSVLEAKQNQYELCMYQGVVRCKSLPSDEQFSSQYFLCELGKTLAESFLKAIGQLILSPLKKWDSIEEIKELYNQTDFPTPRFVDDWNNDLHFGRQRVAGTNPAIIELVREIPDNFPVTDSLLMPLLEGQTIAEAIEKKRLFIVDLKMLDDPQLKDIVKKREKTLCAPICLLHLNKFNCLTPVAIQLFQTPGDDNPIFTPSDGEQVWTLVKMWYNNADAAYHEATAHLGDTHFLMDGFCVITNRYLSPSHPLFKLLAPHFLYLLAINSLAVTGLVNKGGWVDKTMTYGAEGMMRCVVLGIKKWSLDVQGTLPADLKSRGVDDESVLPYYPYRDDGLLLYNTINNYVRRYVDLYYKHECEICSDYELQTWAKYIVAPKPDAEHAEGGLGIKGVPGNGEFSTRAEVVQVLTSIIYCCSVTHAAVNFMQYQQYGFPPNYPAMLHGKPPKKGEVVTEEDILEALPNPETTLNMMIVTDLLSTRGTDSLGTFEVQYICDPQALPVLEEFREELDEVQNEVVERNKLREEMGPNYVYDVLEAHRVPNAISI